MGLKQIIDEKSKSCGVLTSSQRNKQLLDDLDQNTRNSQRNSSATTGLNTLINKDSIRNQQRNHDATAQKEDAQLLPPKMPKKLRSQNRKIRNDLPCLTERYRHLITCQQCEHLTLAGYCKVKPLVKPIPHAMIDCVSFEQVQTARATITSTPYSQAELTALLSQRQTSLLHHVRQCQHCNIEAVRYCADGLPLMDACESVLMAFDTTEQQQRQLFLLSLHGKIPE